MHLPTNADLALQRTVVRWKQICSYIPTCTGGLLRTSPVRSSRKFGAAGLLEVQIQTIGTGSCRTAPLGMVHLRGTRKLGFVFDGSAARNDGAVFVAVEP